MLLGFALCSVHVHKIHYLMGLLVFLKFLSLVLEAGHLLVISIHGHGALYADVPYYTTLTIKVCPILSCSLHGELQLTGSDKSTPLCLKQDEQQRDLVIHVSRCVKRPGA